MKNKTSKKKKRPLEFVIDEPVFRTSTLFVMGCTAAELNKIVMRRFGEKNRLTHLDGDGNRVLGTVCAFSSPKNFCRVVWTKPCSKSNESIGVLAHEIFHLVVRICSDKGVPIEYIPGSTIAPDEAASYLVEYFMTECLKRISPRK